MTPEQLLAFFALIAELYQRAASAEAEVVRLRALIEQGSGVPG